MDNQQIINKLFSLAEKRANNLVGLTELQEKLPNFNVELRQREGAEHIIMLMEEVIKTIDYVSDQ